MRANRLKTIRRKLTPTTCIFLGILLSGCAGNIPPAPPEERSAADPWEPLNRRIHNFNQGFDSITTKPLAKGYQRLFPEPMQRGIANFSNNLVTPLFIVNNLLQGKFKRKPQRNRPIPG